MFEVNERVLCYHGPVIYEAKVLKAEVWDASNTQSGYLGPHYFVHYKGWKASWDEWVHQDRLLRWNDASLAKQKAVNSEVQAAEKLKTKAAANAKDGSKTSGVAGGGGHRRDPRGADTRKRKRDDDDGVRRPDLKLTIPDLLKATVVDDWENITRHHQIVELPRTPNVQDILKEFQEHILNMPDVLPQAHAVIGTYISGLQTYFDRSLGSILLYRFERAQYADMRKKYVTGQHVKPADTREMSGVYGAEHLARLVIKLPEMVAHTTMDDASVALLREYTNELMRWMMDRKTELFLSEYIYPGPHYTNIART